MLTAEQFRRRRALQKYGRNAAGNLVRTAAFRACDYTDAGALREFATEDEMLAFEAERYNDGSGHRVRFSSVPNATVPQEQAALHAAVQHAVAEDGNETRVQLAGVEEGLHAHLDDISQRLDALQSHSQAPTTPAAHCVRSPTTPGDTQLMARVQKSFKVARMNAILKECRVKHRPGLKMADKAALIVEAVPRDRLMEFLERSGTDAPATKKARTETMTPMSGGANPLTNYFGGAVATASGAGGQSESPKADSTYASLGELYQKNVLGAPRLRDVQSATCSTASGSTSPTASAALESQDGASVDCAPAEDAALPRASGAAEPPP